MTDEQVRRYARHILLPEVGGRGQVRLLGSRCTVSVGPERAAETCALMYLAAAGVGMLGLAGDLSGTVEPGEQRGQPIYAVADVGQPRGTALAARLVALNPDVTVMAAADLGGDPAGLVIPDAPWLAFAPAVATALARGGAAACELLGRLIKP